MASINRQTCPTCHQTVNKRIVSLRKYHIQALLKVAHWLDQHNTNHAKMKELRNILTNVQYATFNEWRRFEPDMVFGKAGSYTFDIGMVKQIFRGGDVCTEYIIDPMQPYVYRSSFGTIQDAKGVKEFLDMNEQFIAEYTGSAQLEQIALI